MGEWRTSPSHEPWRKRKMMEVFLEWFKLKDKDKSSHEHVHMLMWTFCYVLSAGGRTEEGRWSAAFMEVPWTLHDKNQLFPLSEIILYYIMFILYYLHLKIYIFNKKMKYTLTKKSAWNLMMIVLSKKKCKLWTLLNVRKKIVFILTGLDQ